MHSGLWTCTALSSTVPIARSSHGQQHLYAEEAVFAVLYTIYLLNAAWSFFGWDLASGRDLCFSPLPTKPIVRAVSNNPNTRVGSYLSRRTCLWARASERMGKGSAIV